MKQKVINFVKDRRGVTDGFIVVRNVILFLLILAVLTIALFVSINSIVDSSSSINTKTLKGLTIANETITLVETGNTPATLSGLTNVVLSNIVITNSTNHTQAVIPATNYSVSGGTISSVFGTLYNNTAVNVSASYTHDVDGDAVLVQNNITRGATTFYSNIPTIFTILGAVIIILAIILIIFAVNRFSENTLSIQ